MAFFAASIRNGVDLYICQLARKDVQELLFVEKANFKIVCYQAIKCNNYVSI